MHLYAKILQSYSFHSRFISYYCVQCFRNCLRFHTKTQVGVNRHMYNSEKKNKEKITFKKILKALVGFESPPLAAHQPEAHAIPIELRRTDTTTSVKAIYELE